MGSHIHSPTTKICAHKRGAFHLRTQ
jgi:hypothetical protein